MRHRKTPPLVRIGILGVIVAMIGTFFIFTKRVPFVHGYRVQGMFQSSNQLRSGSPVRIAGIDVGKVTDTRRGPGTTSIVTMEIQDNGRPVHTDATLRIRPRLFLEGGFYVQLDPGSPSAPQLKDNATIPLGQTQIPVQFTQILSTFDTPTRDSLKHIISTFRATLSHGGAKALGASAKPAVPALKDVAIISKASRGTSPHDLSTLVRSLARVVTGLSVNDGEIGQLVTGFNQTTGALAAQDKNLAATIDQVDAITRAAPPALNALDRALPVVERFSDAVSPSLRVAPPILRSAVSVLQQARALTAPGQLGTLVSRLAPSINRLPTTETRLKVLFPLITPVMDCLSTRVVPVLNSKVNDGALSSNRPIWQDFVHSLVSIVSADGEFDGVGPWIRLGVGVGASTFSTGLTQGTTGTIENALNGLLPGSFTGTTSQPVEGARPTYLGSHITPPLNPAAPCRDQPFPNLTLRASGSPTPTTRSANDVRTPAQTRAAITKYIRQHTHKTRSHG